MKKKLSHAQMDVLVRMALYGEKLRKRFPLFISKAQIRWSMYDKDDRFTVYVKSTTAAFLEKEGYIEMWWNECGVGTTHHYRLTQKGKEVAS